MHLQEAVIMIMRIMKGIITDMCVLYRNMYLLIRNTYVLTRNMDLVTVNKKKK